MKPGDKVIYVGPEDNGYGLVVGQEVEIIPNTLNINSSYVSFIIDDRIWQVVPEWVQTPEQYNAVQKDVITEMAARIYALEEKVSALKSRIGPTNEDLKDLWPYKKGSTWANGPYGKTENP